MTYFRDSFGADASLLVVASVDLDSGGAGATAGAGLTGVPTWAFVLFCGGAFVLVGWGWAFAIGVLAGAAGEGFIGTLEEFDFDGAWVDETVFSLSTLFADFGFSTWDSFSEAVKASFHQLWSIVFYLPFWKFCFVSF